MRDSRPTGTVFAGHGSHGHYSTGITLTLSPFLGHRGPVGTGTSQSSDHGEGNDKPRGEWVSSYQQLRALGATRRTRKKAGLAVLHRYSIQGICLSIHPHFSSQMPISPEDPPAWCNPPSAPRTPGSPIIQIVGAPQEISWCPSIKYPLYVVLSLGQTRYRITLRYDQPPKVRPTSTAPRGIPLGGDLPHCELHMENHKRPTAVRESEDALGADAGAFPPRDSSKRPRLSEDAGEAYYYPSTSVPIAGWLQPVRKNERHC